MPVYEIVPVSSLEKIFPDSDPSACEPIDVVQGLAGETVSFQLAYRVRRTDAAPRIEDTTARVEVTGALAERVRLRAVRAVPVEFAAYPHSDDAFISHDPGLYPDLLQDTDGLVGGVPGLWRSLWVDVELPDMAEAAALGDSVLSFAFVPLGEGERTHVDVTVRRIPAALPEQTLMHTEWLHADCLAQYYGVPVFSEEHWRILENFIALAVRRGVTMIYTPLFTPPLDTVVGGERPTTQLVGVERHGDDWSFDFALFERWVAMCRRCGVRWFEMSHLFTQWGAAHSPKVVARVDGVERRVFGWDTDATDPREAYAAFLAAFLPALDRELKALGIAGDTVFHISDEPSADNLDTYLKAKAIVAPYLKDYRVMDALSHIEFYQSGACEHPVPAADAIEPFVEAGVEGLWTYYCCAQSRDVPNRFMAMPSWRNRVLGFLLYAYDLAGFLHWGYDFYNTQYSMRPINPYVEPAGPEGFPAGDAFLVYPGRGGLPEESMRGMVLAQAMNDLRACRLLESLRGREFTLALINEGLDESIRFAHHPHSAAWLLDRRRALDEAIAAALA